MLPLMALALLPKSTKFRRKIQILLFTTLISVFGINIFGLKIHGTLKYTIIRFKRSNPLYIIYTLGQINLGMIR